MGCAIYSRNKLNDGFVTTISASFNNSIDSGLLKSPSLTAVVFWYKDSRLIDYKSEAATYPYSAN